MKACFSNTIFMISQIVYIKRKQNFRAFDTYINNNYTIYKKSMKMTLNLELHGQKTQITETQKTSFQKKK